MKEAFNESTVEEAALSWFDELGYAVAHGPDIAPEQPGAERESFNDVLLVERLRDAIDGLNPNIPDDAREDALRKVLRPDMPTLVTNNRAFHRMLRDGVEVEYRREDGTIAGDRIHLVDYDNPDNNDWLVVNQFTVIEGQHNRRPDVVVFLNGMPISVLELKNAADEDATIRNAFNQLQTYKQQISSLFVYNETLIVSDGLPSPFKSVIPNASAIAQATEPDQAPHSFSAKYTPPFAKIYRDLCAEIIQRCDERGFGPNGKS